MSAYLLRECAMRYEVQFSMAHNPSLPMSQWFERVRRAAVHYGSDKNGLFVEREDAERCAKRFTNAIINEVEVPPDYNGEQDHA